MPGDEDALAVDSVGVAGEEGDEVLVVFDADVVDYVGSIGVDDVVVDDPVGEGLVEYVNVKDVSDLEAFEGDHVKEDSVLVSGVCGEDGVSVGAADGQAAAVEVAGTNVENFPGGAVVDGHVDPQVGVFDGGHDAGEV